MALTHGVVVAGEEAEAVAAVAADEDYGGAAAPGDGVEEINNGVAGARVAAEVGAVVVEVEGYGLGGLHAAARAEARAAAEGVDAAVFGLEGGVYAEPGERAGAVGYDDLTPGGVGFAEEAEIGAEDVFELAEGCAGGVDARADVAAVVPTVALKKTDYGFLELGGLTAVPFYEEVRVHGTAKLRCLRGGFPTNEIY